MAARTSRASRSAAQAKQDSTTVVPIGGAGKSATGDNGGGRAPAKPAATKPAAKPASKPVAQPKTTVSVETYQKPFYRPTVNGKPIHCEHDPVGDDGKPTSKYGHDSERAALACGRKLAAASQPAAKTA